MSKVIATGIALLGVAFALLFTDLGVADIFLRVIASLLIIYFPDFWGWLVISRYTYEPAPDEWIIAIGWISLIYFVCYVSYEMLSKSFAGE